jgi:RNA polymerase sigma factor (sigma-70 family)
VDDELSLLARWTAGENLAGEQLCMRHHAGIYRFFEYKITDEADDLTQQTFLACLTSRERFRGTSSFRTYLFAIAKNVLYSRLRQKARRVEVDLEASSLEQIVTSPSERLGRLRDAARLRAALRQLPVAQQVLLEFHYWHDLDMAGLAEVFETTPGAIRVRLLRARRTLRDRLDTAGELPAPDDRLSSSLREPDLDQDEAG